MNLITCHNNTLHINYLIFIMQSFLPTVVLRHKRENLKKCSLRGFESHPDFKFYAYPHCTLPDLSGYIILDLDAPPLMKEDASYGLVLLDSTWRYAEKMLKFVEKRGNLSKRSIPAHFRTAYPRRQDDCSDPTRGLASIEAIYIAHMILGRNTSGLLDGYYWKDQFLGSLPKSSSFN